MRACLLNYFKKRPSINDDNKPKAPNFKTLVPPVFEEDTSNSVPSCSSTSSEVNRRTSRLLSRKKDKDPPLPPVVTEVSTLICEAESATKNDFAKSVELLEKATTLGSACAAAKLALVYHSGNSNSDVNPDYANAAAYYFLALKLIYMIPCEKWDMTMLLEVIAGLSEIYRKQISRRRDSDIWNTGVRAMLHIDSTLKDPATTRHLEHEDYRRCKAIRIHINYCLAMTAEFDNDYTEAVNLYEVCKRIGECNFATADKLVKKSCDSAKMLQRQIPKVKPICVSCDYQPKETNEIWKLLVCSKCQVAAACSRECLTKHMTAKHHTTQATTRRNPH
jgi:hypothetical protein